MAVVIEIKETGVKVYKSSNPGIISDDDLIKANRLNDFIHLKIDEFIKENQLEKIKKNRGYYYWHLGNLLRDIYFNSGLVIKEEKMLFFRDVRIHLPEDFFPKNDEKRKRNIPAQFFKLAAYPYNIAMKVKWAQWSYLFDNRYLMEYTGFDDWFSEILADNDYVFNESFTRLWAETFNLIFKRVDISDWSEDEFFRALRCTLDIIKRLIEEGINIESRELRKEVRAILTSLLKTHRKEFILMQMMKISEFEFVNLIATKTKSILLKKIALL